MGTIKIMQETTTDWKASYRVPCHTYYVDGAKMVAYIPEGTKVPVVFAKPQSFDKRGRSFRFVQGPRLPTSPVLVQSTHTRKGKK